MTNEELCKRYQNGEKETLGDLYEQNKGLIEIEVRKYGTTVEADDLRQESFFAIRQAAALWDHSKGGNFATYCRYWIRQTLYRYVCNNCGTIRAPIHTRERILRYNRAVNSYRVQFGQDPDARELCYALEINLQQLETLKRDITILSTRSASAPVGEDGEETLQDFLKDDRDPIEETIERIHRDELRAAIEKELQALPEREAAIIRKRYFEGLTLKETSDGAGITPERVRQLEARGLRILRRPAHTKQLKAYLTDSGAYSAGLHGTGLTSFRNDFASAQERALVRLERMTGRIWEQLPQTLQSANYDAKKEFSGVPPVE